jgi:hypothetical protein
VGKYGTNLEGFGAFEGGVNADKGAPLVSTSSDGETALLFGPAALREIQAGVANGDFAIPPDDAEATITEENPLPYWTFTDTSSSGKITAALVNDTASASANVLRFTAITGTAVLQQVNFTRYVPIPSSRDRAFAIVPELYVSAASGTKMQAQLRYAFYTSDLTLIGSEQTVGSRTSLGQIQATPTANSAAPSNAAYVLITVRVQITTADTTATETIDISEVRLSRGGQVLVVAESITPASYQPLSITQSNGTVRFSYATNAQFDQSLSTSGFINCGGALTSGGLLTASASAAVTGDLTATGNIGVSGAIYGTTALTGPNIDLAGTNTRLWTHSSSAADVAASTNSTTAGVLLTKATAGQPSTNINGTATTDAFADALRNGGIAVDTTNNRGYFYSGGWKYAALTTPSDSRLKEEITDITGALDTLRQLVPVAFKWKRPEAHGRSDAVADDGTRLGFIADQVATTDLAHWVETLGVDEREADLVDTTEVLAVNIPQNEMEALVVQALLDIDARLKALEAR